MVVRKLLAVSALVLLVPAVAHAASAIDQIVSGYQGATQGWEGQLQTAALRTFGLLALVQLGWAIIQVVLSGRTELSDLMGCLIREVVIIGAYSYLLLNYATINRTILDSFQYAAGIANGSHTMSPGDVFNLGIDLVSRIGNGLELLHLPTSILLSFAAVIILVTFMAIAATMGCALIESYFFTSAGVLFMAAGGWSISRDVATGVIRVIFGIGARLFVLQLLTAVGTKFMQGAVNDLQSGTIDIQKAFVVAGEAIVLCVISHVLPTKFERVVSGSNAGFAGAREVFTTALVAMGGAYAAGEMAGKVGTGLVGASSAATQATRLAESQVARSTSLGMGPSSMAARIGLTALKTAGNLASGVGRDIGSRISGQAMVRGRMGFRIAADIKNQEQQLVSNTPSLANRRRP